MSELPRGLKALTIWLLLGTAVFLGVLFMQRQQEATRVTLADGAIELKRGPDGHFHWPGAVNGVAVDFLVDTGATRTALPENLARLAGLQSEGTVRSATAGGTVQGWQSRADIRLSGGLQAERLPVTVLPGLGKPLLGMDLLSRLHFSQSDGVLRLEPPP